MKYLILTLGLLFAFSHLNAQQTVWQPSPPHTQVPIWPGAAPDPQPVKGPEAVEIDTKFLIAGKPVTGRQKCNPANDDGLCADRKKHGAAVVVFPGGGYQILAIDLEGTEVCDWLTRQRDYVRAAEIPRDGRGTPIRSRGPYPESPMALEDAQRTLRTGALPRGGVAHRSAQDWGAGVFGGRTPGCCNERAF